MMNAEKLSVATLFAYFYLAGYSLAIALASPTVPTDGLYCSDRYGYRVQDGVEFMPEDDPCKKCQCQNGFPVMCRSVQCSPPQCSMYESMKNECCDFRCIEPSLDMPKNNGNGSSHIYPMLKDASSVNLSIRLVASAVTSLLIFALLIFMIHRLRQRRLLISMRRLNSDRRSVNDGLAYMTNIDQLDIGFEFPPYEDPPPPYSPPKPIDDDIPADDPPPYELTSVDMETQSTHIIHTETNAAEVRGSDVEEDRDEADDDDPLDVSAATAVMLLGNARWMDKHCSLRRLSALQSSFQSELIELSRPNLDCHSTMTMMSSPVLTGQKRIEKDGRCWSSRGYKNNRRSEELFSAMLHSNDSNLPAPSQMAANHSSSKHSALKHLAIRQIKSDSSTPQALLKMHNKKLTHPSLLKHAVNAARSSSTKRMSSERIIATDQQHLFLPTNFCEATSSSDRVTRNVNDLCDATDLLNVATAESEADNETRVKRFSSLCGAERRENDLMQRSAPEVSIHFKSSQVLCTTDPRKEKKPVNLMKIKDKSKPFLCSSSFMKKQKYPSSRPQSYSGPDIGPSIKGSSMAHNLSGECYNALSTLRRKTKKKATDHPPASSCLFVHLVHDDASSSCIRDSNADKTQLCINGSATTLDNGNNRQTLDSTNQSDYDVLTTRRGGLAAKQTVLENTLMADFHSRNNQSRDVALPPSPAQRLLSPDLPVYRQFLRSESITSQASFHSICSETGEKKHTKSVLPNASKGVTVQGTMSTGCGYLSPDDTNRITGLKEIAGSVEKNDFLSGASMEATDVDNCIINDSVRNTMNSTISTSTATSSKLPVQGGSYNYSMSDWKVKEDHSTTKRYDPSINKMTNEEKRSVSNSTSLQDTLANALSFSSPKCLRELRNERISESNQLIGTKLSKAQSDAQNIVETNGKLKSTQLYSNAGEAELSSYLSCKVTVKAERDDKGRLMFKDQLRQGVRDLVPGHKKHSSNVRHNEHLKSGKKQKSKHMESFEYLVSRILHQLETTSHFDELAGRQKVQRPQRFGHKFNCYSAEIDHRLSSKSVAKQSRPISLPNTKPHSSSSSIECSINAELANLDFANRNNCMLEHPIENDNDGRCQQQQQHHVEDEAGIIQTDGTCHSSGSTPVSVAL